MSKLGRMSVIVFGKAYRDQHWQKCRYGLDLRNCGSEGRVTDGFKKRMSDPDYPTCLRDGKTCDAKWEE